MTVARPVAVMPGWASRPSFDPECMPEASTDSIRVLVAALDRDVRIALAGVLANLGHDLLGCVDVSLSAEERARLEAPAPPPEISPQRMLSGQLGYDRVTLPLR